MPLGFPSWTELIGRLYKNHGLRIGAKKSFAQLAGALERKCYPNERADFCRAVQAALYEDVKTDFASLRRHHPLAAIASVAMLLQMRGEAEIITFNFDDLLELYLRFHGFHVTPVHLQPDWAGRQGIVVYHPHGYLPKEGHPSLNLVLTENAYGSLSSPAFRPFRQKLLCTLRSRLCLFIGVSGRDAHMNRLLTRSKGPMWHAIKAQPIGRRL